MRYPSRVVRRLSLPAALLVALVGLSGCTPQKQSNARADYQTNLDRTIEGSRLRTLSLRTGAGSIEIVGEESRRTIEIVGIVSTHAETFGEAKRIAGEVRLNVQAEGTENPIVRVTEPRLSSTDQYYSYDLTVKVPHNCQISLEDSSGPIEVGGLVSGLRIENESGPVSVETVTGGIVIQTAGNRTTVKDASGHLQIKDGAGDIDVAGVTGDVEIQDGGGKLVVQNVSGDVTASDNPTGAQMKNIDGDVTLIRIEPATSKIQGVTGNLSYPSGTQ